MHRIKSAFGRTGIVLTAVLLALLFSELGIRAALPQTTYKGGVAFWDELKFDLKPGFSGSFAHPDYSFTAHHDEAALRQTLNGNSADGSGSILVLGDSFAYGLGVQDDQTLASFLAGRLQGQGIRTRVANAACPSYTLSESFCKYERLKSVLHPKVVIVAASFNDDVANLGDCGHLSRRGERLADTGAAGWWVYAYPRLRDFLLGHSHLVVLLAYRLNTSLIRLGLRDSYKGNAVHYCKSIDPAAQPRSNRAQTVLNQLHDSIQKENASGVFVYIPGILEIRDDLWTATVQMEKDCDLVRDRPRKFLLDAARRAGFSIVVDPLADEAIRRRLEQGYFPLDGHLNVRGHEAIADALLNAVTKAHHA